MPCLYVKYLCCAASRSTLIACFAKVFLLLTTVKSNFDHVVNCHLTHISPIQCLGLMPVLSPLLSAICSLLSLLSDLKCQYSLPAATCPIKYVHAYFISNHSHVIICNHKTRLPMSSLFCWSYDAVIESVSKASGLHRFNSSVGFIFLFAHSSLFSRA